MLRYERDYIMRMIAAAAAAVARLRARLTGGAPADEIVREAREAQVELLGNETPLLRALDTASASHAIGDPERLLAWADLIRVEAEALRIAGDESGAALALERAEALSRAAATL